MTYTPIPPCPKCGDTECGFWTKGQSHGPVQISYDEKGEYDEMFTDHVYTTGAKAVRCGQCNKIRRDLEIRDHCVMVNESAIVPPPSE